jgi:hypothetical protein
MATGATSAHAASADAGASVLPCSTRTGSTRHDGVPATVPLPCSSGGAVDLAPIAWHHTTPIELRRGRQIADESGCAVRGLIAPTR